MTSPDPAEFLRMAGEAVDRSLDQELPSASVPPERLHEAMRYSVFAGGKRLRPSLCLAAYGDEPDRWETILPVASAIEMIHTYSLIHDDLPAMDDDDFRRGRPSCHKQYGEAMAILAGDALLTLAFEVVSRTPTLSFEQRAHVATELAQASGGSVGMIAGQVLDLETAGDQADVESIHRLKTGALIAASVWIGGYLRGAEPPELRILREFGRTIGLAFQIVDDILDVTSTREALGKSPGKDRAANKATYPSSIGMDASRKMAADLTSHAYGLAECLTQNGVLLAGLARVVETRAN